MARHVDDVAGAYFANLVHAVSDLLAAVLDVHHCVGVWYVATIFVGNSRHWKPDLGKWIETGAKYPRRQQSDAERFQLAVER